MKFKLGIIGVGVMGQAILSSIINKKVLSENDIALFDISKEKLESFTNFTKFDSAEKLIENCEYILLAIKPQHFKGFAENVKFNDSNIIISIMAGIQINTIRNILNTDCLIARVMPNTPCRIGNGICAVSFSKTAQKSNNDFIKTLLSTCGKVIEIEESLFDAVTSVSGSGPAYVYMFIDAMIKGGIDGGLSYEQSKQLAIETIIGTSMLALQSNEPLDDLIEKVCSKGGTTIEAVNIYRENNLIQIIRDGMSACKKKSELISKNI